MKYGLPIVLTFSLFPLFLNATIKTNKTTFIPRPKSSDITLSMLRWHSHTNDEKKTFGGRLQLAPFYSHSTNSPELGKYFMFEGKNTLAISAVNADVHPYNFNLGDYIGTISLRPKQEVYGARIDYFQHINWLDGLYWSVSAPVIRVSNDPGLRESITANGALSATYYGPLTVTNALAGHMVTSDWSEPFRYGKIDGKQTKTGVSDIDVKLGYTLLNNIGSKIALTFGATLPTSNKPQAVYMFEPLLGNGGHWALGAGLDSTFRLCKSKEESKRYLYIVIAGDFRYLFENNQMRTLELKGKSWGRYIRMRQENPQAPGILLGNSLPGVNVMTQSVKVTPGSQLDAQIALCFSVNNNWHLGLGYNAWMRSEEKVNLKNPWGSKGNFGLICFPDPYVAASGAPSYTPAYIATGALNAGISSNSTIGVYASGNGILIQPGDIDTAPHPFALTHKIFGLVDYTFDDKDCVIGAFASYEFAAENTALEQWDVGVKLGTSF